MGSCSLYIISWRPFSGSAVHSHAADGCWFKVIEAQPRTAQLTETRWDAEERVTIHTAVPGVPGFIHNSMGKHKVVNTTAEWVHSLHLYPNA
jgi:Cysteine dioxygenase type I